jgi:glutamyl-tRNA reductase
MNMHTQFRAISLSYQIAPLRIREQIALSEQGAKRLMLKSKEFFEVSDLMVVSTCNRTEIYYTAASDLNEAFIKLLLIENGITDTEEFLPYFEQFADANEAVNHLFEVATGLHSQVVGDMQIPNQVKQSYQWSADLNMAGPFLHRLMHTVFFVNKRVAQETAFRDGAASTSYATVDMIERLTVSPSVVLVGLGEIGTDVCKNLAESSAARVTLVNRTRSKAEELAQVYGFEVMDWGDLPTALQQANVVVSSVVRNEPVITKDLMAQSGGLTFKYLFDLSVPRSIEAAVEEVPGVVLYTIDNIRGRADEAMERRLAAIPAVKEIIAQALADFNDWSKEMVVSPTIHKLKNALEQIRQEELARHLKSLSEEEAAKIDRITASMMQKIIKLPVLQLKAACKRGEAETLIDVLNDLFDLEKEREYKH